MTSMENRSSVCAIEIKDIKKSFGPNQALAGISLTLPAGGFFALLGRNGSGKSTLIKILTRQMAPDSGDGHVLGIPLWENSSEFNAFVGFASEATVYAAPYSMEYLFSQYRLIYPNWDSAFFQKMVDDLKLDLRKRFGELSRGQRMQVATAVAMSIRPRVLLLDEVTSVLDAGARSYVMCRLAEFIKGGGTVVMATNVVSEVHHVADWLVFLEGGEVKLFSRTDDVSASFRRLCRPKGFDHPIFHDPRCVEISIGENDSTVCLLPVDRFSHYRVEADILDSRKVTAEEVFIYYTKGREEI